MQPATSFEDLVVWQKAHEFVLAVYQATRTFPREEAYGLTSQFRRASVSVAANIAEGFKKRSPKEKGHFLNISQGSLEESRYYLILAEDLEYGRFEPLKELASEVAKLLFAYAKAIKA